jgi:radical SAM superfamily enzyme YgiQ (UPF0313 family)
MSKKLILINPPSPWLISDKDMPPMGILYLASYLREKKIDVHVTDLSGLEEKDWKIPDADIYGISCVTPQFHIVQQITAILRHRQKKALIILGGFHPSSVPEETLNKTESNLVVKGEGEEALESICNSNQYSHEDKKIIVNSKLIQDINLPFPARDLIDIYAYQRVKTKTSGDAKVESVLISSRGCPYKCSYCAQGVISQNRVRFRSIVDLGQEVRALVDRYDTDRFYLLDDTFNISEKRVMEICDMFLSLAKDIKRVDWHCVARTDLVTDDSLCRMSEAGCIRITYGIESGSSKILKFNEKRTTPKSNHEGISKALKHNIEVRAQMIVGLPGETDETIEETAEFIRRYPEVIWGFHIFVPLPGSPVWNTPERFHFKLNNIHCYQYYQTLGKPDSWDASLVHQNPEQIKFWVEYLRNIPGSRHAFQLSNKA